MMGRTPNDEMEMECKMMSTIRRKQVVLAAAAPAVALCAFHMLVAHAQTGTWTPPIGIPAPPLGISEVAGPATAIVNPGQAIPNPVPAGAVVEIRGTYTQNQESPRGLVCAGTASNPAFIRGAAGAQVTGKWEISGSNCIVEGLTFRGPGLDILSPADRIVIRDSEVIGTLEGGGLSLTAYWSGNAGFPAQSPISNIVLLRLNVHDNGNVNDTGDQDVHGIGLYRSTSNQASVGPIFNVWLLDSELARNSGDGIQVNAGTNNNAKIHHVYIGRTRSHHNKQTGFALKQASDVILSENRAYSHRPSSSAPGGCFSIQYGPERVWALYNEATDCSYGFYWASDLTQPGQNAYFVGNNVHDIQDFPTDNGQPFYATSDSPWGPAGFTFVGGVNRYLARNTVANVPFSYGLNIPNSQGKITASNNPGLNVWMENPPARNLCGTGTLRIGERPAQTSALSACSSAQNAAEGAIASTFESLYGLVLPIGPAPSPSPTVTPAPTLTATQTPAPSSTPTPAPTATSTPEPGPTATASPTPGPTPTPLPPTCAPGAQESTSWPTATTTGGFQQRNNQLVMRNQAGWRLMVVSGAIAVYERVHCP